MSYVVVLRSVESREGWSHLTLFMSIQKTFLFTTLAVRSDIFFGHRPRVLMELFPFPITGSYSPQLEPLSLSPCSYSLPELFFLSIYLHYAAFTSACRMLPQSLSWARTFEEQRLPLARLQLSSCFKTQCSGHWLTLAHHRPIPSSKNFHSHPDS